ncbi:MAG: DUF3726 domain-containing protein [Pseudomonadota bacterium]
MTADARGPGGGGSQASSRTSPLTSALAQPDVVARIEVSMGELEAEARKAARGAGLSWGLSEDVGAIVRALACLRAGAEGDERGDDAGNVGLPWEAALTRWLLAGDAPSPSPSLAPPLALAQQAQAPEHAVATEELEGCPIALAAFIGDGGVAFEADRIIQLHVATPALLLSALMSRAPLEGALRLEADGCALRITVNAIMCMAGKDRLEATLADPSPRVVQLRRDHQRAPSAMTPAPWIMQPRLPRAQLSAATWAHLKSFAARTYVPQSARSRETGAGAGLSDND